MELAFDWVRLLFTYGPFGLIVFFLFFAEARARSAWRTAPAREKKLMAGLYLATWAVIFGLTIFSAHVWKVLNVKDEFVLQGRFGIFEPDEQVVGRYTDGLFLRKIYQSDGTFHYEWRLVSRSQLEEGSKIRLTVEKGNERSEKAVDYLITVKSDFLRTGLELTYDRGAGKVLFPGGEAEIVAPTRRKEIQGQGWSLFPAAHAAEPFSSAQYKKRLESSDLVIRRDARTDLAKEGAAALPWIQSVLADGDSSYRLKLGVIIALDEMPNVKLDSFPPRSIQGLVEASVDRDETLRGEARRVLRHKATWALEGPIRQAIKESAAQSNAQRTADLARSGLDLLYNVGVFEMQKYGTRKPEDRERFSNAVKAYHGAWDLREYAAPADKPAFPKALYGWGHALHDKSWIERGPNNARDPAAVKAAQDKFSEFLREARKDKGGAAYPLPEHLAQAEAYLKKPEPESLTLK